MSKDKIEMKRFLTTITISLLLFTASCSNKKQQEAEAMSFYNQASEYYKNNDLKKAEAMADSMLLHYSKLSYPKAMASNLKQQIAKDRSMAAIDSISETINQLKIEKLIAQRETPDTAQLQQIDQQIDSLELLKKPFRELYNGIVSDELRQSACRQCVVHMQNARR